MSLCMGFEHDLVMNEVVMVVSDKINLCISTQDHIQYMWTHVSLNILQFVVLGMNYKGFEFSINVNGKKRFNA